jgi:hypothetical protein
VLNRRRSLSGGAALLLTCGVGAALAASSESPVIDPDVRTAVVQAPTRVLVELRLPLPGGVPPSGAAAAARERAITAARQTVLTRLTGTGHRLVRQYTSVALLALEIGPDALQALEGMGDIVTPGARGTRPPSHRARELIRQLPTCQGLTADRVTECLIRPRAPRTGPDPRRSGTWFL